ncbi:OmpA family protein [Nitratireductor sp. GISD-1A_MAKvit]|uniref:OmpA family protein n=1 Tax=Nitratireductor sp. GISD-1A_MAKvit TaxID=3234198 RepID=UPI00346513F2
MTTRQRIMTTTALGLLIAAAPLAVQNAQAIQPNAGVMLAQAEKPEGMSEEAWRALLKKRERERQSEKTGAPASEKGRGKARGRADDTPDSTQTPETEVPAEEPPAQPEPEIETVPEAGTAPTKPTPDAEQPTAEPIPSSEDENAPAEEVLPESAPAPQQPPEQTEAADEALPEEEQAPSPAEDETDAAAPDEDASTATGERSESATPNQAGGKPVDTGEQEEPTPETPAAASPVNDAVGEADEEAAETETLPENAAPVLDSQKGPEVDAAAPTSPKGTDQPADPAAATEEATVPDPVPEDDAEAQVDVVDPETLRKEIRNLIEEQGERIEMGATREDRRERRRDLRQRREDAEVVREFNDNRTIVQIDNQIFVESPDSDRLIREGDDVYYEELPRGRVREVITRPDGVRLITVRNRYGDVIRRVRVAPEGREQVLVFVPEERLETVDRWHDPARDLPPLRLSIPVSDYILEAERVEDPDRYYTFLGKPPVERVQRMYSLEEVKRSARVRDMVRRIDLDTIEFAFGSANIGESEIDELEAIATAIERMLEQNPAETFLIEGHTDAVGSDLANLALSDRRAESVARALTDVFGIPPENLVTQGYGERYLKIDTQKRERENRRVALRRITPLVAPIASAN